MATGRTLRGRGTGPKPQRRPPIAELPPGADPYDYLNERQRIFAKAFVCQGYDVRVAAREAGYAKTTALTRGREMLADEFVLAAIRAEQAKREKELVVSQDRVILELARIAFADATSFLRQDEDGTLHAVPLDELSPNQRAVIVSINATSTKTTRTTKDGVETTTIRTRSHIKLHDKMKALVALGKQLGMWAGDDAAPDAFGAGPGRTIEHGEGRPSPYAAMAKQYLPHIKGANGANGHDGNGSGANGGS